MTETQNLPGPVVLKADHGDLISGESKNRTHHGTAEKKSGEPHETQRSAKVPNNIRMAPKSKGRCGLSRK